MTGQEPDQRPSARARVLIADDHEILRRGLRAVLEAAGHEVCAEVSTGREAVVLARELLPDLVILDLTMPDLNGLEATRQIVAARPQARVLILTIHQSEKLVRDVLAAGARGYVLKSDVARDLLAAVAALLDDRTFFTSSVGDIVLSGFLTGGVRAEDAGRPRHELTAREREIVQLIAEGSSTKEIARKLSISVKTVESHRTNAFRTLGVHSVSEVVRYAIRNGIVEG
jgi:DNA-binding NarL/FixJ family response regulator